MLLRVSELIELKQPTMHKRIKRPAFHSKKISHARTLYRHGISSLRSIPSLLKIDQAHCGTKLPCNNCSSFRTLHGLHNRDAQLRVFIKMAAGEVPKKVEAGAVAVTWLCLWLTRWDC